jgi:Uma2 family endonuclease
MPRELFIPDLPLKGEYIEQMSEEEFFQFCQDNRKFKFERNAYGQIFFMSPTTFVTGDRNREILHQISTWNNKKKLGRAVDSDTGFTLPNGAVRNPDAAWVSNVRLKTIPKSELEKFPRLVPDFIVELKSKHDRLDDLKCKMKEWMENGCRLGWLIDVDKEVVYIYEGMQQRTHKDFSKALSGEPVLTGFKLKLAELKKI